MYKESTAEERLGIIGGGNMGSALIGGLLSKGYPLDALWVCDHKEANCKRIHEKWSVQTTTDHKFLAKTCQTILVAVKPQSMKAVCEILKPDLQASALLISIAAGIKTSQIEQWLNAPHLALIRAMPNLPSVIGLGITGLYANHFTNQAQVQYADKLLTTLGKTVWLEKEDLIDVVTALSGSGPGYFFYILEAMINAGVQLGLSAEQAKNFVLTTMQGSAQMLTTNTNLQTLREEVTSKGGTTQAGIGVLEAFQLPNLIFNAINAATIRAKELSQQFD